MGNIPTLSGIGSFYMAPQIGVFLVKIKFTDSGVQVYSAVQKVCPLSVFSCDQAALWMVFSVRPFVRLSHLFDYVPIIVSSWNFQELSPRTRVRSMQKVKIRGQRSRSQRSRPNLTVSGLLLQLELTYDDEMMHIACCIGEVPYCFSRSSIKFQGHTGLKIVEFDLDWAFPDCNSSLNSPMAMKCCTKLETAKERYPIVFQGHPSNFKLTRYKASPILTQIGLFRTIGRSQLSNPSDLPWFFLLIRFFHTSQL